MNIDILEIIHKATTYAEKDKGAFYGEIYRLFHQLMVDCSS
ncbi:hypothetical protein METH109765_18885 [Mesobacillus thioparans]